MSPFSLLLILFLVARPVLLSGLSSGARLVPRSDSQDQGAKAAGCHVYEEGELLTHDGRQGREVGIADFDGNLTVVYNIPANA